MYAFKLMNLVSKNFTAQANVILKGSYLSRCSQYTADCYRCEESYREQHFKTWDKIWRIANKNYMRALRLVLSCWMIQRCSRNGRGRLLIPSFICIRITVSFYSLPRLLKSALRHPIRSQCARVHDTPPMTSTVT